MHQATSHLCSRMKEMLQQLQTLQRNPLSWNANMKPHLKPGSRFGFLCFRFLGNWASLGQRQPTKSSVTSVRAYHKCEELLNCRDAPDQLIFWEVQCREAIQLRKLWWYPPTEVLPRKVQVLELLQIPQRWDCPGECIVGQVEQMKRLEILHNLCIGSWNL